MPNDTRTLANALRQAIRLQPGEHLFGVVDGARDLELAHEAKRSYGLETRNLFDGDMAGACADVAPYVIAIDPATGYLGNWAQRWDTNSGILLTSRAAPAILHAHLREIFIVKDEQGQQYFFRYYDPRVLRAFIPTCKGADVPAFFGPISTFLAEGELPATMLSFQSRNSSIETQSVLLR